MKIDQPYIPLVTKSPKPNAALHSTEVAVVQPRPKRREEQPKKQSSQQNKKNSSRNPLFSSLVARELSSRLASEVHDHEPEVDLYNLEEIADKDMTEEEFLALQAEVQRRESQSQAPNDEPLDENSDQDSEDR